MADTVTTRVLRQTKKRYIVVLQGLSDGTGETDAIKIDKSTLTANDGAEPSSLTVDWIQYAVQGYTRLILEWDLTTDEIIARIPSGGNFLEFAEYPSGSGGLTPAGTGGTGDIVLTTAGAVSGGSYTIIMAVTLED